MGYNGECSLASIAWATIVVPFDEDLLTWYPTVVKFNLGLIPAGHIQHTI